MKLIRFIGKTAFVIFAIAYATCILNGISVVEYYSTDDGGTLTVAGRTVEVNTAVADAFLQTYTEAEKKAAKYLPQKIKNAVNRISDLLDGAQG